MDNIIVYYSISILFCRCIESNVLVSNNGQNAKRANTKIM